jgi:protein phosphatase
MSLDALSIPGQPPGPWLPPPPYDVIGDVHGCMDELEGLLLLLGYARKGISFFHPLGRRVIFLGDLTDRGPRSVPVMEMVLEMTEEGRALYVPGNHCVKLARWMKGAGVKRGGGIQTTIDEIESLPPHERSRLAERFTAMVEGSPSHLVLDGGRLVVSHGGITEEMIGLDDGRTRAFCLYGDTTGRLDEKGLPGRRDWAAHYRGDAFVVYGHTPAGMPEIRNNTINIDGGCVLGGHLCALRWPEKEIVTFPAKRAYWPAGETPIDDSPPGQRGSLDED